MTALISAIVAVAAILAIVMVSMGYHAAPFRTLPARKPKFQVYPKYRFRFASRDAVFSNLVRLGFVGGDAPGHFVRGVSWGDFSTTDMRLNVRLHGAKNEGVIYASDTGILYDTGDLWQVASDIVAE